MNIPEIANCQLVTQEQGHFEIELREKLVITIECYELMCWILDRDILLVNYMLKTMPKDAPTKEWIIELDSLGYEFKDKIEAYITEKEMKYPGWIFKNANREEQCKGK